jgi:hypothetical protein
MRQVLTPEAGPGPAAPARGNPGQPARPHRRGRREGWPGEIEGLKVSLAGTEDKLAQIDATLQRQDQAAYLGMPAFPDIAGRSVPGPEGQP